MLTYDNISRNFLGGAVFLFLAILSCNVAAQDRQTCTWAPEYGDQKEFTVEQYFEQITPALFWIKTPVDALQNFDRGGCDGSFLNLVIEGHSKAALNHPLEGDALFDEHSPAEPGFAFDYALELYFLGQGEFLNTLLAKYAELRDSGNGEAATTLAYFGGVYFLDSLSAQAKRVSDRLAEDHPFLSAKDLLDSARIHGLEDDDSFISVTTKSLENDIDSNLQKGMDLAYAPAFARYVTNLRTMDICNGLNLDLLVEYRQKLSSAGIEKFVSAVEKFAFNGIASSAGQSPTDITIPSDVRALSIDAANALSMCGFDYSALPDDHGSELPVRAHDLVHLAAHAWDSTWPDENELFTLAYSMQENAVDDGAHYAAARLFVNALSLHAGNDFVIDKDTHDKILDFWFGAMNKRTVVEAQKMMKEYGLYRSGIDGIVGRGFRAGISKIGKSCQTDYLEPVPYPNLCVDPVAAKNKSADWLKPYLRPLSEIEARVQN
jgi:hypothetical protein